MILTIENPVKEVPEKIGTQPRKVSIPMKHQEESKASPLLLHFILGFIFCSLILAFSWINGKLFFYELMVSSLIILSLVSFKVMDSKGI
ncbi:MAG: hypothetical protein NXI23_12535 [Bacteroidetes bacterium]|nr:hypothetical protein [Bacteroidota bacterium]